MDEGSASLRGGEGAQERRFGRLARAVLGRDLRPDDGIPEERIRAAESRLGIVLPVALRKWSLVAGAADQMNRAHDVLFAPEDLMIDQDHLLFMEENQAVVHWGIPVSQVGHPDPIVWQRVNSDAPEWHSEELDLTTFIVKRLAWQAGIDEP